MEKSSDPTPRHPLDGLEPDLLMVSGLRATPSNEEPPKISGIDIQGVIGRGGMGTVYLARQPGLDRLVAVKRVAKEWADDPVFIERLEREARMMARLRHPHIVAVHQFERLPDGGAALVMEYIGGGNLRKVIKQHPEGMPIMRASRLLIHIAEALEAAHHAGVIHRDIKPENVLIAKDGSACVTDFGIALPVDQQETRLTRTGVSVGTLDYMAPEQWNSAQADAQTDVYALGVVWYEMLTGKVPRGHFAPPQHVCKNIPRPLGETAMRALHADPARRYACMAEFAEAVRRASTKHPVRREFIVGGSLALAGCVGGTWAWLRHREAQTAMNNAMPSPVLSPAPETLPPATGPSPVTDPPSQLSPVQGSWSDLLATMDVGRARISGNWERQGTSVRSGEQVCILALADRVPPSYEVRMTFTRLSGQHSIALFFTANNSLGSVEIDGWGSSLSGVQLLDGRDLREMESFDLTIQNGKPYLLHVHVQPSSVHIRIDNESKGTTPIGNRSLGIAFPWRWDPSIRPAALAIGSYESSTHFERVEWRSM